MKTTYEWVAEQVDEYEDITEIEHSDKLAELLPPAYKGWRLGLVRSTGDEYEGLADRYWQWQCPRAQAVSSGGANQLVCTWR